jgi:hypothetical protein
LATAARNVAHRYTTAARPVAQFVDLAGGRGRATIAIFAGERRRTKSGEEKAVELRGWRRRAVSGSRAMSKHRFDRRLLFNVPVCGSAAAIKCGSPGLATKTEAAIHARYEAGR